MLAYLCYFCVFFSIGGGGGGAPGGDFMRPAPVNEDSLTEPLALGFRA